MLLKQIVASELKDPICHSDECQIGSFSSEATKCNLLPTLYIFENYLDLETSLGGYDALKRNLKQEDQTVLSAVRSHT